MAAGLRLLLVVTVLAVALPFLGTAEAAAPAARAEPAIVRPGAPETLLFTMDEPTLAGLAAVDVGDRIACQVTAPDGSATDPCAAAQLLDVQLQPGTRTYAITLPAPTANGTYKVHFVRTQLAGLPGAAATADTTFVVSAALPAGEPLASASTGQDVPGAVASTEGGADGAPAAASRMGLAAVAGSGTLLVILVAIRHGGLP